MFYAQKHRKRRKSDEKESILHGYESIAHYYPLMIVVAGWSRWIKPNNLVREKSAVFYIEQVISGSLKLSQGARTYEVLPGQVYLLQRGERQEYGPGKEGYVHKRYLRIEGALLDMFVKAIGLSEHSVINPDNASEISNIMREAGRLIRFFEPRFLDRLSALAYSLLAHLAKSIAAKLPDPVERGLHYIQKNISTQCCAGDIIRESGLSRANFNRIFRRSIGQSPMEFIINQKINMAKSLLLRTDLPIKEIASRTGYQDPLYFSALFKKYTGMSPRKFRSTSPSTTPGIPV
jgi:AraC-like DNA-binding protein